VTGASFTGFTVIEIVPGLAESAPPSFTLNVNESEPW
jgi:hypothetical protein